ncbi:MAG: Gfo/Idh/MocA family oxidoreductase [Coriobacteriia bacterium]
MADKVRVAIVGGGRTGTPLLEDFLKRPFVEVVGVADKDTASAGAMLARERGIFFTENASVLAAKGADIDVIIEVSGDPAVKPALKDAFIAQGNKNTIIVHDMIARLILSLSSNADHLVETYHPEDRGIG